MTRNLGLSILALAFITSATGCFQYSEDRMAIKTPGMQPKTVNLVEQMNNESVWTKEVPPQRILVMEYDATSGFGEYATLDSGFPTVMNWALYDINATPSYIRSNHYWSKPLESGTVELKGTAVKTVWTLGEAIDPNAARDRDIEEIEKDLPEPGTEGLPEPDDAATEEDQ